MKLLNLYAGIGGNRKYWTDCEVTAVEYNSDIASVYQKLYPDDTIIVGDAHEYLRVNYDKFDFTYLQRLTITKVKETRKDIFNG